MELVLDFMGLKRTADLIGPSLFYFLAIIFSFNGMTAKEDENSAILYTISVVFFIIATVILMALIHGEA